MLARPLPSPHKACCPSARRRRQPCGTRDNESLAPAVSPPSSKLPVLLRLMPALPLPSHCELCWGTFVSCRPSVDLHRRARGTCGNILLAPVWPNAQGIGPATTHACEVETSSATDPAYGATPVLIGGSPCLCAPSLVAM
jgi:hypothetical protein